MKKLAYIAIDQFGETYQIGSNPPRKWLLEHFNRQHADKMYQDTIGGKVRHTGYIIAGLWLAVYVVAQWKTAV